MFSVRRHPIAPLVFTLVLASFAQGLVAGPLPGDVDVDADMDEDDGYHSGFSIGGLPYASYNTDNGLGLGFGIAMFDYGDGADPYRHAFYISGQVTTRRVQNYAIDWVAPKLGGTALDWRLKLQFRRQIDAHYFGLGNEAEYHPGFSTKGSARYITRHYNQFIHSTPAALLQLRYPLVGALSLLCGYSFRYGIHETYEDSLLDAARPLGWDGDVISMLHFGLVIDTRDRTTDTYRGHWVELLTRTNLRSLGASTDFFGVTLADHHFFNPVADLVLANRVLVDVLTGDVPLSELSRFGNSTVTDGLGGAWSLRGFMTRRFVGKVKIVVNPEVRYRFLTWHWWNQRLDLGGVAFFDFGRVWRDLAPDGPAGLIHWAGGGGLRLVWNENFLARFEAGGSVEGYGIYVEIFAPY
ncbi:MAG: BamA/TamA family outer membrane protein [Pseudomonadota bacterium]